MRDLLIEITIQITLWLKNAQHFFLGLLPNRCHECRAKLTVYPDHTASCPNCHAEYINKAITEEYD